MKRNKSVWRRTRMWAAIGVLGGLLIISPSPAQAGDWSIQLGIGGYDRVAYHNDVRVVRTFPHYRYEIRRIWVEPVYQERTVRVDVPPVIEERVVPMHDRFGNVTGYRRIREVVADARIAYRTERVLIREGYFESVRVQVPIQPVPVVDRAFHVDHRPIGWQLNAGYRQNKEYKSRAHVQPRRAVRASFYR